MSTALNRIEDIEPILREVNVQCEKSRRLEVCDRTTSLRNLYHEAIVEGRRLGTEGIEFALVCVAVRNLFEIMVLIDHLASSEEAIESWIGQLQRDVLDIHEGLISLFQKHGVRSLPLETSRDIIKSIGEEHGVTPSKPFSMKNIAEQLGLSEDYSAMYKLCSKIIHPSSIRVNAPGAFEKDDDYKNALLHVGIHYLAQIAKSARRDFA
jgi:hypothetical protein